MAAAEIREKQKDVALHEPLNKQAAPAKCRRFWFLKFDSAAGASGNRSPGGARARTPAGAMSGFEGKPKKDKKKTFSFYGAMKKAAGVKKASSREAPGDTLEEKDEVEELVKKLGAEDLDERAAAR